MITRLHNYKELRERFKKEYPEWLWVFTQQHINAPSDYCLRKCLPLPQRTQRARLRDIELGNLLGTKLLDNRKLNVTFTENQRTKVDVLVQ